MLDNKKKLADLTSVYLEYIDVRSETKQIYERVLCQFVEYMNTLSDLPTRSDVMKFRELLKAKNLSATTIALYIGIVRSFYQWIQDHGYGLNVASGIKSPKVEKEFKRSSLSNAQAQRLIEYAYKKSGNSIIDFRNYTIVSLMITTGMRTIEVERTDKADLGERDNGHVLFVMGKGKDMKNAVIRLSPKVYDLIERYIMMRSDTYDPLFINHKGKHKEKRMVTRSLRYVIKKMLRDIDIDDKRYSAHSLRHTAATISINQGANTDETSQFLRHASPETSKIYIHRDPKTGNFIEYVITDVVFQNIEEKNESDT